MLGSLLRMLQLDVVYVRLRGSEGHAPVEMVRFASSREQTLQPHEIGQAFKPWLDAGLQEWPSLIPNPMGGRNLSIVPLGLGLEGEIGELVAGAERPDFPRQTERLILSVAANQASIGLQGARLLGEQKQVANELDRRVAQRTAELAAANEVLRREIADRKRAEEELRNAQAELAHVNRVMTIGELAASIAHEVSQPLASIIASGDSCSAWLANDPPNLEKARAAARRVLQAATQASDVVQRIRTLFKKTTASTASVDLNAVIEDTISLLRHEAQRHSISLLTELDSGVPALPADRVQLQQVILNLVMNGIESTAGVDSEPRRLLIQSALANPREIRVSVKDTGPGIDRAHADRLFAPFFTTKPQGIGMGLPICRSIIEAHGGRLWAENNQPRGAVFHFVLPTGRSAR
ncbi:MAG TPA: ATP-binding protein [Verrucomicrobiae bacterium]|nr:ATP-binding protein [Verrucomicrobiae bacterium]